jgi:hypothetical protein
MLFACLLACIPYSCRDKQIVNQLVAQFLLGDVFSRNNHLLLCLTICEDVLFYVIHLWSNTLN